MGGDVHVESAGIGHGSTFIIEMRSISMVDEQDHFKAGNMEIEEKDLQN